MKSEATVANGEAPPRRRDWSRADTIALIVVTLGSAALRLVRLANPSSIMFDETYYAKDACWYVNVSATLCQIEREQTEVHPPLAKWLMAIGIRLFGYDAFGWRIMAAIAGVATVALLYLLARTILRSTLGATLASGLLAIDLLHYVQSRIAMLDIFVPLFGVAAFLFLAYDRETLIARLESGDGVRNGLWDRPWRIAAGAAAGAAAASKWSGGLFVVAAIVVTLAWETRVRREQSRQEGADDRESPLQRFRRWLVASASASLRAVRQAALSVFVWLIALPVVVYVGTYPGRIQGKLLAFPLAFQDRFPFAVFAEGTWLRALWDRHNYMYDFHTNLNAPHGYGSPPWAWPLLKRPVSYWFETMPNGDYKEIMATGNPFVWWASLLALTYLAVRWLMKRDLRAPEGLILAGFVFSYVPWLLPLTDREFALFIFYLVPTVPFMCLALAYVATRIEGRWEGRAAIALFAAGAIASFIWYFPIVANVPIPQKSWDKRIWVFDDCEKPPGIPTTQTTTETTGTETIVKTVETTSSESLAPIGWCWI